MHHFIVSTATEMHHFIECKNYKHTINYLYDPL